MIIAFVVGNGTFGETAATQRAEAGTRMLVTATALESMPMLALEQPLFGVPARWIGPDGQPRTEMVPVVVGTKAGDEVPIWMDRNGARVPAPSPHSTAVAAGFLSGLGILAAGAAVLGAVWQLVRRSTAAANVRSWGREWATIGPRWTTQQ
ncbi:hypothetical protein K1T35_47790 (plasmid) [Pseudonocardia sp. DSM 110487]|uniref:Rv1733c family protein n=1 Tax=Pseudonocardia sp. DSM 110487 TaxID=2865833 RepID=UPI001C699401|nr:hypothetical protein [Pseudonocardia sp. DSM 110487]QYN41054.1 hypothetical protein K1T35_47790 [Pseudonocardia sp. DSM 110487]